MNGYRFVCDVREPYEASQLATCRRCEHRWVHKFMTTAPGFANSTTFDACDRCWDAEKQQFRHQNEKLARIAELQRQIELVEKRAKIKASEPACLPQCDKTFACARHGGCIKADTRRELEKLENE